VHLVADIGCPVLSRVVGSIVHRHSVEYSTYPWGPRSGPGYAVLVRRHLFGAMRPTRHSQAHPNFIALRLIWNAFAVRERLGDPRVVPSFR
jgi:hypothetical protein